LVAVTGLLRGQPHLATMQLGASIAVAAIPEGLPLLTQLGEAGVARRLVGRGAHVRRLPATEALGRVDVVCADKTGTLTEGKLSLKYVADLETTAVPADGLSEEMRDILLAGAIASPHPERASAAAHPTDVAIVRGAVTNGLEREIHVPHDAETPFAPGRPYHAVAAAGRLSIKGAPEFVAACCDSIRVDGDDLPLDDALRAQLAARGEELAQQGLRVLMVATGAPDVSPEEPAGLVARGFLCIADPLKANAHGAVKECLDAGIRVIMLTGDHPATATAIGREAGLLDDDSLVIKAIDLESYELAELAERLERVSVIARATPLDKLRIIEGLQYKGHTVAMTGDGANDGPALRLADVGVAMSEGTEVARQSSDVVITDFATLVEALTEGRTFWSNIRRTLGLLVGGNFGVLGLLAVPSLFNLPLPFNSAQILAVNLISDALPGLAVTLQPPAREGLSGLPREGSTAIEAPLRRAMIRRALATAGPGLAAYLYALRTSTAPQAAAVAFGSVIATQIAQSLEVGWPKGEPNRAIIGSVASSAVMLGVVLALPPARALLGLAAPTPLGLGLIAATSVAAFVINRVLSTVGPLSERHDAPIELGAGAPVPAMALAPA
ncbi:MAG: HAD-IC family P-type ATPase, partial [Thermomicrobiales bacterium]